MLVAFRTGLLGLMRIAIRMLRVNTDDFLAGLRSSEVTVSHQIGIVARKAKNTYGLGERRT